MKKIYFVLIILFIVLIVISLNKEKIQTFLFYPRILPEDISGLELEDISDLDAEDISQKNIEIVLENLKIPWEIVFLPNGEMLITERIGNVLRIKEDKKIIPIKEVEHIGEGGLLGMAIHPNFEDNNYIFLYFTTKIEDNLINRVVRYVLKENQLIQEKIIVDNIPGAVNHNGGRIKFGPDNYLYITTGDAGKKELAQNTEYLGGKILRVKDDGSIPEDNPFDNSLVYSYGHRNPQGLVWDEDNNLWITEHGISFPKSGYDELNKIISGGNYGWSVIQGDQEKEGMIKPVIHSGSESTWAPANAIFLKGKIFFTGLRGQSIFEFDIENNKLTSHFFSEFGRLRAITLFDEYIYISTSNTDGRGIERENDDKIIKIKKDIFE
jgi:glucose/arabinose dehydrogenase